ncbi:MAG TPA: DUF3828 domain-containing protein [Rhizomicrobium sp.]|jgi:hypothetical protein|nr:DUF3828 domain-containing protein [Rhizomicrobium sp.]
MTRFLVCALLCLFAATPVAAEPSAASAEQFLRGLYAQYKPHGKPVAFVYPDAKGIADPALMALLKHDQDASKGEVGAMDSDPICRCQDWTAIKVVSVHMTMPAKDAAAADVVFSDNGEVEKVHFALVWTSGGWRIHDIGDKDTPSLVGYLRDYKY